MATSPSSSTQLTLFMPSSPSTYWSEAHPAKPSPSPDSGRDLPTLEEASRWSSSAWLEHFARAGSSGRMSPVSCLKTEEGLLVPSSGGWRTSGMGGPTGSWTLSTPEWTATLVPYPSDDAVSSLSDILEATSRVPQRFYLSQKACAGILRRAERRGKALPPMLLAALKSLPVYNIETLKVRTLTRNPVISYR